MKERKFRRKRLIRNRKAEIIIHFLFVVFCIAAAAAAVMYFFPKSETDVESTGNKSYRELVTGGADTSSPESAEAAADDEPVLESFLISVPQIAVTEPEDSSGHDGNDSQPVDSAESIVSREEVESAAEEIRAGVNGDAEIADIDCDWRLILVNTEHRLPDDFEVDAVSIDSEGEVRFDARAADSLKTMMRDCENEGYSFIIRSSYRTMEDQKELFERKTQEYLSQGMSQTKAEQEAATVVAYPGTSEHQLGLAADIVSTENIELETDQENTATQQWLMKNCWKYGFILRYPTTKSTITGIIYEPWHYRYVGVGAAKVMYEENLCLEEYLEKYGNETQPEGTGYVSENGRNGWEEVS